MSNSEWKNKEVTVCTRRQKAQSKSAAGNRPGHGAEVVMAKNKPFQAIAEAIEAGEPPIVDKIIGEQDPHRFWVDDGEKRLLVKKIFRTASGDYVVIARERSLEEKREEETRSRDSDAKQKTAENDRIKTALIMSGYILIGWCFYRDTGLTERGLAYYMPITGPRFVYTRQCKAVWKKYESGDGACYKTAEPEMHYFKGVKQENGLSRWPRKEIMNRIKNEKDEHYLCTPLWLLTSIPDPRPRFLDPDNEQI